MAVRLLLKSAPGVRAISSRLTMVVGVICPAFTASASSSTVTCWLCTPSRIWIWSMGALPDAITTSWAAGANPSFRTVTTYAPTGSALTSNPPSASVVTRSLKSELLDFTTTSAPGTGRWSGSCTTPRAVPKIAAHIATDSKHRKTTFMEYASPQRQHSAGCDGSYERGVGGPRFWPARL